MTPDEQLQALLRIKRYEQPPQGYFDELLANVQRRQRDELLRRPLWQIAIERVQTLFGEHSMGGVQYAGAMAGIMVLGIGLIGVMGPRGGTTGPNAGAAIAEAETAMPDHTRSMASMATPGPRTTTVVQPVKKLIPASHPRYILDSRPVNYEPSFDF